MFYLKNSTLDQNSFKLSIQRSGTVSWVLHDSSDAHHPLSPVIKLGIRHPRKKERKERKLHAPSKNPMFQQKKLYPKVLCPIEKSPIFQQKSSFLYQKNTHSIDRILHSIKRALCFIQYVHVPSKKALHSNKRALFPVKSALYHIIHSKGLNILSKEPNALLENLFFHREKSYIP